MPASPDAVLTALRWRYATKGFDPARRIDPATWAALEQAVVLAPSSYGLQPWTFVVVTDPEVRKGLHPASYNQAQILDASYRISRISCHPSLTAQWNPTAPLTT
ncbi:nitroreductase family protein [Nostoc sp. CENA67]|uniref:Nitroreductase family protein n=1 Tax=Amazonocrinis nigriterrae CENA67 TaxID=2794033 RepID=A0A8J7HVI9_9NOST|nr:nitroreductase family protein [Amazonocrinis nigriterrae CENA67]